MQPSDTSTQALTHVSIRFGEHEPSDTITPIARQVQTGAGTELEDVAARELEQLAPPRADRFSLGPGNSTVVQQRHPEPHACIMPRASPSGALSSPSVRDGLDTTRRKKRITKREFQAVVPELRTALLHLQEQLAGQHFSVLIVLDGDDLAGCDAVFERLHEWLDARYLRAEAFGPPAPEEVPYPWMKRYWIATPPRGFIGVQMRAWTNDVVRRASFEGMSAEELDRRIGHVRRFERELADDGVLLLEFWLHLPKKVLKKRLRAAAAKRDWRIQPEQRIVFEHWSETLPVAEHVLAATDAPEAPWVVVSGEDDRARDLEIARRLERDLRERLRIAAETSDAPVKRPARRKRDPRTVLDDVDLSARLDDDAYHRKRKRWQRRLANAHREACARGVGMVLAFEGWDAAGKGGSIRRLTAAMDATRYRVFPIAAPSERERAHHWLWRFWRRVPRDGRTSIFDRSWYGRVLVERVEGFASRDEWGRAYGEIEDFEAQLVEHGLVVAKFWLHIDPAEQARRFEERKDTSFKRYKITPEDWRNRERWLDYEASVDEMVARTSAVVPWRLIAANDKHHARIEVLRHVTKALEARLDAD